MGLTWIVITSPDILPGEASAIVRLLNSGVDIIHLRKPLGGVDVYRHILDALPVWCHKRIVLHGGFELFRDYGIRGIHLNRRCNIIPDDFRGQVSCSCHSLEELRNLGTGVSYAFLSPIFNSISKVGYEAAFSDSELVDAASEGVINSRVMALGGVTKDNIPLLDSYHFGGFAMLGDIWNRIDDDGFDSYLDGIAAAIAGRQG